MTREERDKAIRILQWLHDNTFLFRSTEEDVKYATKLAIQELEQEPKTEWIPVSERLPEFRKEVLTCSNGGFIEIQSLENSYDGYWENQKGDWTDLEETIAWMPLPKPYEPQERSE